MGNTLIMNFDVCVVVVVVVVVVAVAVAVAVTRAAFSSVP